MSTRRVVITAIAAASVYCGGQLVVDQPLGHAEDGGYVLPDGAPAFVPGQGCEGYAPAPLVCNPPNVFWTCSYGWKCKDNRTPDDECVTAAHAALPHGYPFITGCVGDPNGNGHDCAFNQQLVYLPSCSRPEIIVIDPVLACHTGVDGDAFCSAYLTQYVLGDGVAVAKCVTACTPTDGFDGICETTTGAGYSAITPVGESCGPSNDCDGISMCVTRNGQSKCELPCTSP